MILHFAQAVKFHLKMINIFWIYLIFLITLLKDWINFDELT